MANSNRQNGEAQVSIEIANMNLAEAIKTKFIGGSSSSLSGTSIYRVHEKFRKINKYAYTPEMVSIGPFHRVTGCLSAMERHKFRYAKAFFTRTGKKVEECVQQIRNSEADIRKCYSEPITLNSNEFVEMMLVDGLFIIELFRKINDEVEIGKDDPIFNNIWSMASLIRDMILLENQIPMMVLTKLYEIPSRKKDGTPSTSSFAMLALRFFDPLMPRQYLEKYSTHQGKHLLDLLATTFQATPRRAASKKKDNWKFVPCVTELRRAGVKFRKGPTTGSFLDIKFSLANGILEIPHVLIQDQTDPLLRNLIASEQCCDGHTTYMTSYAFFMDSLINSSADVAILRNKDIVTNYLGDDEDVSDLFNKLCSEATLVNFYYAELCDEVNQYYMTRWHRWRATLQRDYFHNPWTIISFFAGLF